MSYKTEKTPLFMRLWQDQGIAVQGTWTWGAYAGQTYFSTVKSESAGWFYNNTHDDLDEYKWSNIYIATGSYKINLAYWKYTTLGIAELLLGNTSLGVNDIYVSGQTWNHIWTLNFTVEEAITADLRFRVNGKNASSSNHYIGFSNLTLEKIA